MSVNTSNLRMKKLAAGLSVAISLIGVQTHAFAGVTTAVTSCADDNTRGTLRKVIGNAASGDQIDLSRLACANNTITLTQGEVVIAHDVVLSGGASRRLTITSNNGRVLHSTSNTLSVVNLTVSGGGVHTTNGDAEGGCILAAGKVSLIGSVVNGCTVSSTNASVRGGAISAQHVSMVNSRISGSSAIATGYYQLARGGGVYAAGLSCIDSMLSGNSVAGDSGNGYGQGGGAMIANGDVDLSRCTIDTNVAGQGGGIMQTEVSGYTPFTRIQNSTISGNAATFTSGGIEVFCNECVAQPVLILNSTLVFNSSPTSYGDGLNTNGSVDAQSSIIARNGSGDSTVSDLFATELNGADNLVMATNVKTKPGIVTVESDPMLMPLASNGGPTRTHSLSAFSPARNLGNNSALQTTDQRGFSRTANGMVDIGAYQNQAGAVTSTK
jgi:hypothetical protein